MTEAFNHPPSVTLHVTMSSGQTALLTGGAVRAAGGHFMVVELMARNASRLDQSPSGAARCYAAIDHRRDADSDHFRLPFCALRTAPALIEGPPLYS